MKICWCIEEEDKTIYGISWFFHNIQYLYQKNNEVYIRYKGFSHGNYIIQIKNYKSSWKKVDKIDVLKDLPKCDVFIFSGHCAPMWLNAEISPNKADKFFSKIKPKLIIYDCCYMGYLKTVQYLRNCANYLICCSSPSPNVGFVGPKTVHFLTSKIDLETKCKNIIKDFIKRGNNISPKLQYRSNGLLINLKYSDEIEHKLDIIQEFYEIYKNRNKFIKIEKGYNKYGVWIDNFVGKNYLENLVLYHKKNNKLKEYLGKEDKKIKIGLGVIYE